MPAQRDAGFVQLFLILVLAVFLIILGNLLLIDYQLFIKESPTDNMLSSARNLLQPNLASSSADICGDSCKTEIAKQLIDFKKQLQLTPTPALKSAASPTPAQTTTASQPKELFITIGGSGDTKSVDWTDVSGTDITFDSSSYPGLKAVYFQATLQSDAPDRTTYARLYDTVKYIGIPGSDINYTGLTATLIESGPLNFSTSKTKIRVQIHSLNGNDAIIVNPRLRLTF